MAIRTSLSIITVSTNGLKALIKRHRVADWINEQILFDTVCTKDDLRTKDTHRLKVKGWENISCKWK